MLTFNANGKLEWSSGVSRLWRSCQRNKTVAPDPQHTSFLLPSLSPSLTPPPLLLSSAGSQNSPLISTMHSVAGVSGLFFFSWHLDHPSGSALASGCWVHSRRCHWAQSHPRRRQNQANCSLHSERERLGPGYWCKLRFRRIELQ